MLPEKRQKNTIETSKFADPVDAKAITRTKFTEPKKSITPLIRLRETKVDSKVTWLIHENIAWRIRDNDTKTKGSKVITTNPGDKAEKQNHSFKYLTANSREKLQEKRQVDDKKH